MGLAFWCFTYQAIFSQPWRPSQPALKADAPTDADIPSNFLRKVTPTTVEGLNSRASHGNHPVDWPKQGLCNGIHERKLRMNGNIEVHSGLLSVLLNDDCQKR